MQTRGKTYRSPKYFLSSESRIGFVEIYFPSWLRYVVIEMLRAGFGIVCLVLIQVLTLHRLEGRLRHFVLSTSSVWRLVFRTVRISEFATVNGARS